MSRTILLFIILSGILQASSAQWRGPARDGHFPAADLLEAWPAGGPELIMTVTGIGEGFSSPVLHQGTIYVTGKKDTMDYLSSINPDGVLNWQVPYGRSWIRSYANSRSSPYLEENRAYLFSGSGRLVCMNALTGKEIWAADVDKDFEAEWHRWGLSETPLVVDDLVVSTPSGKKTAMVAYNKFSGELVWQTDTVGGQRSYVSPVLYEYKNVRMILGMTSKDLFAVDPSNGEIVWSYPYYLSGDKKRSSGAIITNTPVFFKDEIFVTTGYNFPGIMLKLSEDGKSYTEKWRSTTLDNHHGHVVRVGGHIYGANWHDNRFGEWVCLDWETGETKWVNPWFTKGSIITADNMLYIYDEKGGNVGLLKANPEQFELKGTFEVTEGEGPHWAHPAIYDGKLMIRHGDFLFIYDIRK